jgi:predicted O-methyltransferase YrrM
MTMSLPICESDAAFWDPWQDPEELERLLELFRRLQPRRVLEIGTARGGTLRRWLEHAPAGATVVSVDLLWRGEDHRARFPAWVPEGITFHSIWGDSHTWETREAVRAILPEIDFLFLDGDHTEEGVRQDFADYGARVRPGGVIALHDIARTPPGSPIQVWRLWRELRWGPEHSETWITDPEGGRYGIGVVCRGVPARGNAELPTEAPAGGGKV